ncbi:MAG: hypothetical protein EHM28_12960, partial [Spirochaetaceae bacterium]
LYFIRCGETKSHEFAIQEHLYAEALAAAMKGYYFQRASLALPEKYASAWAREKGHPDLKLLFHPDMKREGTVDSPGGWYDAGDYGKYVVNAGITMLSLLLVWEIEPEVLSVSLNIPESGLIDGSDMLIPIDSSQVVVPPDFMYEMKYELDWLKTMQDQDGGVFFKIGPTSFPDFKLPADDKGARFIIGKSTTSTLDFAAVMAAAGKCLLKYFPRYAADCITRAKRAFEWAQKNPGVSEPSEIGGTGAYGDKEYKDEFLTAAAELFFATGGDVYKKYLQDNLKSFSMTVPGSWNALSNFAFFTIALHPDLFPKDLADYSRNEVIKYADAVLARMNENTFGVPMRVNDFIWGSNSVLLNYGMAVAIANRVAGKTGNGEKYRNALPAFLDYIFGKNATGFSFVTGFGEKTPMLPHHRPSGAGKSIEPVPGLLAGGPNKNMEDGSGFYQRSEPARAYADRQGSYASNEVAINWNAPLVFMLAITEAELK